MTKYYASIDRQKIVRGDDVELLFTVYSDEDMTTPRNISTDTFLFTMRVRWDDAIAVIQKAGTLVSGPNGTVKIVLTPTETLQDPGAYKADLQLTETGGEIDTPWRSGFGIVEDVT